VIDHREVFVHHRSAPRARSGRLALSALVSTVLTALVLSVPLVSGAEGGTPFVAFTSFASTSAGQTAHESSPVIMGQDGPVTSSMFAGVSTAHPEKPSTSAAGTSSTAPAPAAAVPAPVETPAPAPEPVETQAAPSVTEKAPAPAPAAAPSASAVPAPAAPADLGIEGQVLALTNAQRAAAGCGALSADPALAAVARAHSADMRDRNFFSHTNPDDLDPFDRAARAGLTARAENIAYGQPDAAAVMTAWMTSPGHRANILDCSLTRLGVGVAEGVGGPWWTQLFG
jgi:uncharacterized protein YkwD